MEINVNLVHTSRRTVKRGGDLIQRIIISGEVICRSSTYSIGCRNGISKARKCIFCARRRSYACSLEGRINAIFLRKIQLQHNESANEMDICVPGRAQQPFRRMRQPSIWSTNTLNQKLWWTYFSASGTAGWQATGIQGAITGSVRSPFVLCECYASSVDQITAYLP